MPEWPTVDQQGIEKTMTADCSMPGRRRPLAVSVTALRDD